MPEVISGKNKTFFEHCIEFARKFMELPETIELYYDNCPSERFPRSCNAAESGGNKVWFNKQWVYERIGPHKEDVAFFLFHELRHLYQQLQIRGLIMRTGFQEPLMDVRAWRDEFQNYVRNVDDASQEKNLMQSIERDANAYALLLTLLYFQKNSVSLSLPEPAQDKAYDEAQRYLQERKEFKQFAK